MQAVRPLTARAKILAIAGRKGVFDGAIRLRILAAFRRCFRLRRRLLAQAAPSTRTRRRTRGASSRHPPPATERPAGPILRPTLLRAAVTRGSSRHTTHRCRRPLPCGGARRAEPGGRSTRRPTAAGRSRRDQRGDQLIGRLVLRGEADGEAAVLQDSR